MAFSGDGFTRRCDHGFGVALITNRSLTPEKDRSMGNPPQFTQEIRVGVSACLLGQEVRYNGGHARDRYVVGTLADYLTLVPVCPEEEVGMGTPRETVRLVGDSAAPRMLAPKSGEDWTDRMNRYSARRVKELAAEDLCGFVFKKGSPSCGVFRVKVYTDSGNLAIPPGRGLFAAAFAQRYPLAPIEEEGRLHDARLRENFLERVFAYRRLKNLFTGRWARRAVIDFHSREKYLLMAHSPQKLKELGQLTARIKDHKPAEFRDAYMKKFMEALELKGTTRKHVNTLQHMVGFLRDHLDGEERKRVLAIIEDYRQELVPLVVPMTLIRHYIEMHDVPYVKDQTYLHPHPKELMLRNHV
jgi:uncharacterized protein YbgA (DUF1722 family)/uncharacterized protein YbbK (DUF523 family)